jgi:hypothetical protein
MKNDPQPPSTIVLHKDYREIRRACCDREERTSATFCARLSKDVCRLGGVYGEIICIKPLLLAPMWVEINLFF